MASNSKRTRNENNGILDKKRIEELRNKLNSEQYIKLAVKRIASDLTYLLLK